MAYPSGLVVAVENNTTHRRFVNTVEPDWILVRLDHARQIAHEQGETAQSFFSGAENVLTTSTIEDHRLAQIGEQQELDIVQSFQPDAHIPSDVSAYPDHRRRERARRIQQCMEGTIRLADALSDSDISIIPLVKGLSRAERDLCYEAIDILELEMAALFCTRYFSAGNRGEQLVTDVAEVAEETDLDLLTIGVGAPQYLRRLPEAVIATTAFNRWRSQVSPASDSPATMDHEYQTLKNEIETALGVAPGDHRPSTTSQDETPTGIGL